MTNKTYRLSLNAREAEFVNAAIVLVKDREDCKEFLALNKDALDIKFAEGDNNVTKSEAGFALGACSGHTTGDFMTGMGVMFKLGEITTDGEER